MMLLSENNFIFCFKMVLCGVCKSNKTCDDCLAGYRKIVLEHDKRSLFEETERLLLKFEENEFKKELELKDLMNEYKQSTEDHENNLSIMQDAIEKLEELLEKICDKLKI
jgi:hypothetical protein